MSPISVTTCPMIGLALYFTPTYITRSAAPEVKLTVTLPFAITAVPKVGDNLTQFASYKVTEGRIAGKFRSFTCVITREEASAGRFAFT